MYATYIKPLGDIFKTLLEFVRQKLPSYSHKLPNHVTLHKSPNAMKHDLIYKYNMYKYSFTLVERC